MSMTKNYSWKFTDSEIFVGTIYGMRLWQYFLSTRNLDLIVSTEMLIIFREY